jgi:predicted nucleic acid-binding protein
MVNKCFIIDTNVFIAANSKADHLSESEIDMCKEFVASLFSDTIISLDEQGEIFHEYFNYMSYSGQPGIGDTYVKFLWDRQSNRKYCEKVDVRKDEKGFYKQLRKKKALQKFDLNDQKFIAVCVGSKNNPVICNATDSDWENNKTLLSEHNIRVLEILQDSTL